MLGSTMRPDGYHGVHARAGFFEGWYVKLVSADRMVRLAVIPGIFLGVDDSADRRDEAFVQVLDVVTGRSWSGDGVLPRRRLVRPWLVRVAVAR